MDPLDNRSTPLPILEHMPPHVKIEIGNSLEYYDKVSLRNVNRDLRRVIRAPDISLGVLMGYNRTDQHQSANITVYCDEPRLIKTKSYSKNEQGWLVETMCIGIGHESTVQKGENISELISQYFENILHIPNLTMRSFTIAFSQTEQVGIMSRIRNVLSNLETRLKVENIRVSSFEGVEVLSVLPYLNTNVLTELDISSRVHATVTPYSTNNLELHRFPNLKKLSLQNIQAILPVEDWWNIDTVNFIMRRGSETEILAQLPRIIEHLRQLPTFERFELIIHSSVSEMKTAIGAIVQWDTVGGHETFHLPADGSNFGLNGQLRELNDGFIVFTLTS